VRVKCDFVISAFGSQCDDRVRSACAPLTFNKAGEGDVDVDRQCARAAPWLFAGGDLIGHGTTVEAANDGKTASWHVHRYVQSTNGNAIAAEQRAALPPFFTDIDRVDLSSTICGLKFPNPFGLASATPCTSAAMIRRAFEQVCESVRVCVAKNTDAHNAHVGMGICRHEDVWS
jgi:dihydropyrimidine dehydrogenase (NADP+)